MTITGLLAMILITPAIINPVSLNVLNLVMIKPG